MARSLVTAPTDRVVTLSEVKNHLRIFDYDNDDYLNALVLVATSKAESFCNRRFLQQTWNLFLDSFPNCDEIALPFGALQSVTHIKYTDSDDSESTFSSSYYSVDTDSEPGRIVLDYDQSWPTDTLRTNNPIEIQFVCGFYTGDRWTHNTSKLEDDYVIPSVANDNGMVFQAGGNGTTDTSEPTWPGTVDGTVVDNDITWTCVGKSVPKPIKQAVLLLLTDLYKQREPFVIGVNYSQLKTVESLLWPYRVYGGAL